MHSAYLIDPAERTIKEVIYSGDYKQISQHLGCTYFDVVRIANNDAIFVDDEGMLTGESQSFFVHTDYPQPLAGRGLVLGTTSEGESVSPKVSLDELRRKVLWVEALF